MKPETKKLLFEILNILFVIFLCYLFYQVGYNDALTKLIQTSDGLYNFCVKQFNERLTK